MTEAAAPPFVRPRVAAGVLFTNHQGDVLMVYPSYKDYLDIPGGYVEPGETPAEAALREVREELTMETELGDLLVTDWWRESTEGEGGAKMLFVFDGGTLTTDDMQNNVKVDGQEIVDCRFHNIAELDELTVPRLANRIRHALESRKTGLPVYLENGRSAMTTNLR